MTFWRFWMSKPRRYHRLIGEQFLLNGFFNQFETRMGLHVSVCYFITFENQKMTPKYCSRFTVHCSICTNFSGSRWSRICSLLFSCELFITTSILTLVVQYIVWILSSSWFMCNESDWLRVSNLKRLFYHEHEYDYYAMWFDLIQFKLNP